MAQIKKVRFKLISRQQSDNTIHPVYILLDELVANYHPDLVEAKIAIEWEYYIRPDKDDHVMLGCARKTGDADKELHGYDAVICLNYDWWHESSTTEAQKKALLDHEITHISPVLDENGDIKKDEVNRNMYRIRKHDFEEFFDVVQRHGIYKADLEKAARILSDKIEVNNESVVQDN